MDVALRDLIQKRAYEIWQYRQEFDVKFVLDERGNLRDITAQDDWLEAEEQVLHAQSFPKRFAEEFNG